MKILLTASEAVPFSKTGGLADVTSALAHAMSANGHDVLLVLPDYPSLRSDDGWKGYTLTPLTETVRVPIGKRDVTAKLLEVRRENSNVRIILVSCPLYFDRPGLYGVDNLDFGDNCERFSFFSHAVLSVCQQLDFHADIVHANDWQTGLVPALLDVKFRSVPQLASAASILTIHNLAFQGVFPEHALMLTGLGSQYFTMQHMEYYGQINLLKTGVTFARKITTVSPTYAEEIQTAEFGCGLEAVLSSRKDDLVGITNGIDPDEWNPATDPLLPSHFNVENWSQSSGKPAVKQHLQSEFGLPERPDVPLFGIVSRLTEQKGIDLLLEIGEEFFSRDVQLVLLGTGNQEFESQLEELGRKYPEKCAIKIGFSEPKAHLIEAGADAFLMPSQFEPCGLNQMYSQRYGTVPIVRLVGGLADTVVDADSKAVNEGVATGFGFRNHTSQNLLDTIDRACSAYRTPTLWKQLVETGMRKDFSWATKADDYLTVYEQART
ncbi:glycogen synthase GlgA [Thalassoroseus pseudoceratinae]|uniref:glycogen synthase GlgA n=1 Tax=Thalassoroseus pseudoceratinae TaxID=2713176 RepID=UPI00141D9B4D|nr:glycogen synthase GlgA [Thalassoroseus pseudoceratinae]